MTNGPVEPRPAATVVLLREGAAGLEALLTHRPATMAFAPGVHVFPGGRVDPADSAASLVARSAISPVEAAAALGGDLAPGPAHRRPRRRDPRAVRGGGRAAGRRRRARARTRRADRGGALGAGARRDDPGRAGRRPRPAAADRPARPVVALGDAAVDAAPVRRQVLRRDPATRRGGDVRGRRGGGPRVVAPDGRAGGDGRRSARHVAADQHDPPAARARPFDRGDPRPAGAGTARPDRGRRGRRRRHPDRHARRRRCRRPAGVGLSRRPASVRARRSGRSVGPGARSRAGPGARPRRRHRGDRPDPCRPGPRRGRPGRRRDPRDPRVRRSRWRCVAAIRDPRAARSRHARCRGHRAPGPVDAGSPSRSCRARRRGRPVRHRRRSRWRARRPLDPGAGRPAALAPPSRASGRSRRGRLAGGSSDRP